MNRANAVARIQRGLGFRTDQDTSIILALQEAQRLLEMGSSLPWFLASEDVSMSGTANDGTVSLPTGFIRLVEDETFRVVTASGQTRFLVSKPYDWLVAYVQGSDLRFDESDDSDTATQMGDPRYFALRSTTIEVAPVPTATFTVYASYYKKALTLDTNTENVWLDNVPELLIGMAGASMASDLGDSNALKLFSTMEGIARANLLREIAARETQSREIIMGAQG